MSVSGRLRSISRLAATKRLSAADLAQNSNSAALNDYRAFKVLEDLGMVLLPLQCPYGLMILDTADFKNPKVLGALRTVGYASKLVRDADYLYLPMGSYGVRRVQAP